MSVAAVTQSVDSAELVGTVGALLPLLFAFVASLCRRDEEPRTATWSSSSLSSSRPATRTSRHIAIRAWCHVGDGCRISLGRGDAFG